MSFEKEIKILNISVDEAKQKLNMIGAKFVEEKHQKIYTYDLPTISHRFQEIIDQLKKHPGVLIEKAYKQRLKNLFIEIEVLLQDEDIVPILNKYDVISLDQIVEKLPDIDSIGNLSIVSKILNMGINPNKWVRLRRTGNKSTLTVKHVFNKNNSKVQKVGEFEIVVSNVEDTDMLLSALGFAKRNVQEKIRTHYEYKGAEIDIDQWPFLEPYIEIESDDETLYNEIIDKCNYTNNDIVSCNTEELYKKQGMNIKEIPELLFEKNII